MRVAGVSLGVFLAVATLFACDAGAGDLQVFVHGVETSAFPHLKASLSVRGAGGEVATALLSDAFTIQDGKSDLLPVSLQSTSDLPEAERPSLGVVLVIDNRSSLKKALPVVEEAVKGFLAALPAGTQAGLITFKKGEKAAKLIAPENLSTCDHVKGLLGNLGLEQAKKTPIWDGLGQGIDLLSDASGPVQKAVVVLCCGDDGGSSVDDMKCYKKAKENGVSIYFVWTGTKDKDSRRMGFLGYAASGTGGSAYPVGEAEELKNAYVKIAESIQHRYQIDFDIADFSPDHHKRSLTFQVKHGGEQSSKTAMVELPESRLYYLYGQEELAKGSIFSAIRLLDKALVLNPADTEIRDALAVAKARQESDVADTLVLARNSADSHEKRDLIERALAISPQSAAAQLEFDQLPPENEDLGFSELDLSDEDVESLERGVGIRLKPKPVADEGGVAPAVEGNQFLGNPDELLAAGRYEEAVAALEGDPHKCAAAYVAWGDSLGRCSAIRAYLEARRLDANCGVGRKLINCYIACGNYHLGQKHPARAAKMYELVLKVEENEPAATAGLAMAFLLSGDQQMEAGDYGDAIRTYRKSQAIDPDGSSVTAKLAAAYFADAEQLCGAAAFADAARQYQKLLELDPSHGDGLNGLIDAARRSKDHRLLVQSIEGLLASDGVPAMEREGLQEELAMAYVSMEDFKAAKETIYHAVVESQEPLRLLQQHAAMVAGQYYLLVGKAAAAQLPRAAQEGGLGAQAAQIAEAGGADACWLLSREGKVVASGVRGKLASVLLDEQRARAFESKGDASLVIPRAEGENLVFVSIPLSQETGGADTLQLAINPKSDERVRRTLEFLAVDPLNESGWELAEHWVGFRAIRALLSMTARNMSGLLASGDTDAVEEILESMCAAPRIEYVVLHDSVSKRDMVKGFTPHGPLRDAVSRRARETTHYLEQITVGYSAKFGKVKICDIAVPLPSLGNRPIGVLRFGVIVPDISGMVI